jgi:hypothetical protein
LTGQPAFANKLVLAEMVLRVVLMHKRPDIPEFVFPSARELITESWAEDSGNRLSFDEIVSSTLSAFVKEI